MPARIIDPDLQARVVRQFNLLGPLAPFNLTENVVPIFDIGQLIGAAPTVITTLAGSQGVRVGTAQSTHYLNVEPTFWSSTDIVNSGAVVNPAAGAVIVDTGQLSAAFKKFWCVINWNAAILDFQIEWRNAANSATLATIGFQVGTGQPSVQFGPVIVSPASNERLRVVTASGGTGTADATVISNSVVNSAAS